MIRRAAGWLRTRKTLGYAALCCVPNVGWTMRIDPIGRFRIKLRRDRRYWLRHPFAHEWFMLGALRRLTRPGDVVYDVGANLGLYSRVLVQAFGASRVMAFEPMADNRAMLIRNAVLGGVSDRVRIFPLALGDHDHDSVLHADDIASGSAVLDDVTHGAGSESHRQFGLPTRTERVQVVSLDGLIRRESLPPPSVMKIDVEGAEGMVLRGAAKTIDEHRPRLAIELHGVPTMQAVLPWLHERGYHVWGLCNDEGRAVYRRTPADAADSATDYFAIQYLVASVDESDVGGEMPKWPPDL